LEQGVGVEQHELHLSFGEALRLLFLLEEELEHDLELVVEAGLILHALGGEHTLEVYLSMDVPLLLALEEVVGQALCWNQLWIDSAKMAYHYSQTFLH
jgi:hypothetical protein